MKLSSAARISSGLIVSSAIRLLLSWPRCAVVRVSSGPGGGSAGQTSSCFVESGQDRAIHDLRPDLNPQAAQHAGIDRNIELERTLIQPLEHGREPLLLRGAQY